MSMNETCGPTLHRAAQTFAGRFTGSQVFVKCCLRPSSALLWMVLLWSFGCWISVLRLCILV